MKSLPPPSPIPASDDPVDQPGQGGGVDVLPDVAAPSVPLEYPTANSAEPDLQPRQQLRRMLVVALAIRLTSKGPAFYRQTRTGWDRSTFQIWKFRTMYVHDEGPGKLTQAARNDSRRLAVKS